MPWSTSWARKVSVHANSLTVFAAQEPDKGEPSPTEGAESRSQLVAGNCATLIFAAALLALSCMGIASLVAGESAPAGAVAWGSHPKLLLCQAFRRNILRRRQCKAGVG